MGQVVGRSTSKGERPASNPYGPEDLFATIFRVLGLPNRFEPASKEKAGDRPVLDRTYRIAGNPIPELF